MAKWKASRSTVRAERWLVALLVLFAGPSALAEVFLTEGTNISVDVAPDGRLAIDLLGGIWIVPAGGGGAVPIASGESAARAPRWSPDGHRLLFEANREDKPGLRVHTIASGETRELGNKEFPAALARLAPGRDPCHLFRSRQWHRSRHLGNGRRNRP